MTVSPRTSINNGGIKRNLNQAFGDEVEMQGNQKKRRLDKVDCSLDEMLPPLVTDVIVKIFSHLSIKDLKNCSLVNKQWQKLPENDSLLLKVIAFDKEKWEKHIGKVEGDLPFPTGIIETLRQPCPYFPGKRVYETHMLTLTPTTVNDKPLTINSIEELVKHPKVGYSTRYGRFCPCDVFDEHGDKSFEMAHWVLITKYVIPESRGKSYKTQVELVGAKEGYEVPKVLDMITSIFMHYVLSGNYLFRAGNYLFRHENFYETFYENLFFETCTRCQETLNDYSQLIVGGFDSEGLIVDDCHLIRNKFGVAAQRKFS